MADVGKIGVYSSDDLPAALEASSPDVVIDFTSSTVIKKNLEVYAELGFDAVVGTTGLTDKDLEHAADIVSERGLRWVVVSNFALGANLILDFIEQVRKHYPYVSIVDRHPSHMLNAPSGTGALMAQTALKASPLVGEITSREVFPNVLGGDMDGMQLLSQRFPYPRAYSEHEITLARKDELIRVTLQDFSSQVYVDGAMLALRKIKDFPPGTLITRLSEITRLTD